MIEDFHPSQTIGIWFKYHTPYQPWIYKIFAKNSNYMGNEEIMYDSVANIVYLYKVIFLLLLKLLWNDN